MFRLAFRGRFSKSPAAAEYWLKGHGKSFDLHWCLILPHYARQYLRQIFAALYDAKAAETGDKRMIKALHE